MLHPRPHTHQRDEDGAQSVPPLSAYLFLPRPRATATKLSLHLPAAAMVVLVNDTGSAATSHHQPPDHRPGMASGKRLGRGEKKGQVKTRHHPRHQHQQAPPAAADLLGKQCQEETHDREPSPRAPPRPQETAAPPRRRPRSGRRAAAAATVADDGRDDDGLQAGCGSHQSTTATTTTTTTRSANDSDGGEEGEARAAPRTWVGKVEWALGVLGGRGTLAQIYAAIEDRFPEEVDGKRNWKAAIRSCLSKNEKHRFAKPGRRRSSSSALKDHLWCLAPSVAASAAKPRGRPPSRASLHRPASPPADDSRPDHHPQPRPARQRQPARQAEAPRASQTMIPAQVDGIRQGGGPSSASASRPALATSPTTPMLPDPSPMPLGEDGLSADQEDFLRELLG